MQVVPSDVDVWRWLLCHGHGSQAKPRSKRDKIGMVSVEGSRRVTIDSAERIVLSRQVGRRRMSRDRDRDRGREAQR